MRPDQIASQCIMIKNPMYRRDFISEKFVLQHLDYCLFSGISPNPSSMKRRGRKYNSVKVNNHPYTNAVYTA